MEAAISTITVITLANQVSVAEAQKSDQPAVVALASDIMDLVTATTVTVVCKLGHLKKRQPSLTEILDVVITTLDVGSASHLEVT